MNNGTINMKLLLRWICTSIAIFVVVKLLPGIRFEGPWWQIGIVSLIFGLLNALVRPILMFLTCPLILLTLELKAAKDSMDKYVYLRSNPTREHEIERMGETTLIRDMTEVSTSLRRQTLRQTGGET